MAIVSLLLRIAAGLCLAAPPAPALQPPSRAAFERLLQRFVDQEHGRAFRRIGDEDDFDHAHLLFARSGRLVALLYHTQELAADSPLGYLDSEARNWLQWPERTGAENAVRYERREYPDSPAWEWFRVSELPALRARHTITERMLDPRSLGAEIGETRQWVFTRVPCAPGQAALLRIRVPGEGPICLSLSRS